MLVLRFSPMNPPSGDMLAENKRALDWHGNDQPMLVRQEELLRERREESDEGASHRARRDLGC